MKKVEILVESRQYITVEHIQNQNVPVKFCSDFLVLYGLTGRMAVNVGKNQYELSIGGILTICPFTHYEIRCAKGSELIALHISQEVLQMIGVNHQIATVHCYTADDSSGVHGEYDYIRMYLARTLSAVLQSPQQQDVQQFTNIAQMMELLISYCSSGDPQNNPAVSSSGMERYDRIMTYIHEHWQEPLSIEGLAKMEYVSAGYLARTFKAHTGKTLTEYLVGLRLQNAAQALIHGTDTITEIAYNSGFRNANSFISYFKSAYGVTPREYRTSAKKHSSALRSLPVMLPEGKGLAHLLEYASMDTRMTELPPPSAEIRKIELSAAGKGDRLRHTWKRILNTGYASSVLQAEVQNRIRQAQQEIGFEYIRFHGLLDKDMYVYFEDEQGEPYLDFSRVDILLDFVLSVGMKPYLEFGYMPELLAEKQQGPYERASCISMYKSEQKWSFLVKGLLTHCLERYGRSVMNEWKFTTISINSVSAGFIDINDYLRLYHCTYRCVKEIDPKFAFGGPGGFASNIWDSHCIHDFLQYAVEHHCVPDFICTESFPHRAIQFDSDFWKFTLAQTLGPAVLSSDVHYVKTMLQDYRAFLNSFGLSHLKIWIEGWNSTLWQRDLSGDTCYKAAWLVHNICENYDEPEAFGYWTLSDFMNEISAFGRVYHGGYGLFTYNGIPKSGWQGLRLLRMLGNQKLKAGNGWLATRNGQGVQIIMSHYCHYDNLYCLRYKTLEDPRHAYSVFKKSGPLTYRICLSDLPAGKYEVKHFLLSPKYGSSFDIWLEMGMPQYLRRDEIEYLKQVAQPQYRVETVELSGEYTADRCLHPHEVQIILINANGQPDNI